MHHVKTKEWRSVSKALAGCEVVTITPDYDVQVTIFDEDGGIISDELFAADDPVETVKAVAEWLGGYADKPRPCVDLLEVERHG